MRIWLLGVTILCMKKRKIDFKRLILVFVVIVMMVVAAGSVILNGLFFISGIVQRWLNPMSLDVDTNSLEVEYGSSFDASAIVSNYDGDLEVSGDVNTHQVGDYPITYTLKKGALTKQYQYTVTVKDTSAPVIALLDDVITVQKGSVFDMHSVVSRVSDTVDGDLTYESSLVDGGYTIDGSFDTNTVGTYPFTVTAQDNNGLQSQVQGYVVVGEADTSPYMIRVNRALNTVTVYAFDVNGGTYSYPVKAMLCSVGTETPVGIFQTFNKGRWRELFGGVYGQYVTDIVDNILFHSVPYYTQNPGDLEYEEFNKLGTSASLGCVRLDVKDVKWIYDNCALGMTVEIYDDADNPGPLGTPEAINIDTSSPNCGWDPTDPDVNNPWRQS